MFSIDEIKNIRKQYVLRGFKTLEARKIEDNAVLPEKLSVEERNRIISALFLYRTIKETQGNEFQKNKTEQEILDEIQTEFPPKVLSSEPKTVSGLVMIAGRPTDSIMCDLAKPEGEMNYMAEAYLQYVLAGMGKKAINIKRGIEGGMAYTISYDLTNLEKKNDFKNQLNPKNPIYTQPTHPLVLTEEQKANRRKYVENALQYYDMMEHDDWYKRRVEREEKDMQFVANIVNNNEQIGPIKNGPGLFYLLKAAQNLSIQGEKDFFEELLEYPEVNKALLEFKSSEQPKKMKEEALENEKKGKISEGKLMGHIETQGEKEARSARICMRNNPNIVSKAKKAMITQSYFTFGTTTDDIRLSYLYSLIARTQGKIPTRVRKKDTIEVNTTDRRERE